jgi:N-acetylneuraminic acid mutarotase
MPTGRNHLAAAAYGGRVYAIAGRSDLGAGVGNLNALEEYDPASNIWRTRAPVPNPRSGLAAVTIGHFIFAVGGEGNDASANGTFADNDAYNAATNTWTPVSGIPTPVHGIGAAALAGRMHVPGGGPIEGFSSTDLHQVYDPATDSLLPNPISLWPVPFGVALALLALLSIRTRRRA